MHFGNGMRKGHGWRSEQVLFHQLQLTSCRRVVSVYNWANWSQGQKRWENGQHRKVDWYDKTYLGSGADTHCHAS